MYVDRIPAHVQWNVRDDPGDSEPNCRIPETHGSSSARDQDTRQLPSALCACKRQSRTSSRHFRCDYYPATGAKANNVKNGESAIERRKVTVGLNDVCLAASGDFVLLTCKTGSVGVMSMSEFLPNSSKND